MNTALPTRTLRDLDLETEYRTGECDLMSAFYRPCLARSTRYDRAVGYFRSTVFAVAGEAVVAFARRGGRMRFVCSPVLGLEDIEAMDRGYDRRAKTIERLLVSEVETLLAVASLSKHAELLATLIAVHALDLRVAIRPPGHGIYHEKLGIFSDDDGNAVSFKGSSNETWNGWHDFGNLESFETFCSWGADGHRVRRHRQYFERLWLSELNGVSTVPFPEAARERLCRIARNSVDELDIAEVNVVPESKSPLPHQRDAIANWIAAGERGILQHATGSGKTVTALIAIARHVRSGRPAIVLVPSRLLLQQWDTEIRRALPDAIVLLAGGGNVGWRKPQRLESFTADDTEFGARIVLSTMHTARNSKFLGRLREGEHLLIVADEVHQTGSRSNSRIFQTFAGARLGLSATPQRYGDPEGTARLFEYFGGVIKPLFTLVDAIAAGRLVPYEYHAHPVHLTAPESEQWKELSARIIREAARGPRDDAGKPLLSDRIKLMLIQRARIAKKAHNKIALALSILQVNFEPGQRWLVYCEDLEQLATISSELRNAGLPATEYFAEMTGDKLAALDWLRRFGGIVVSIRCLDEGVDIPEVSHALILASSQNPRQFIQRRGRVLRKAPDKYVAVIHDAIVVPPRIALEPEQAALARAELARAIEFSAAAINKNGAAELADIADNLGISLDSLNDTGLEEQNESLDS